MIGVGRDGPTGPDHALATRTTSDPARGAPGRDAASRVAAAGTSDRRGDMRRSAAGASRSSARRPLDGARGAWAVLASVDGLGPVGLMGLVVGLDGPEGVLAAASGREGERRIAAALEPRGGRGLAVRIVEAARGRRAILASIEDAGLAVLTLDDTAYPQALAGIELPPPVLFVRGVAAALAIEPCIAVVGTRRPTDAGRAVASRLAGTLARTGAAIASGLAVGIDGAAHAAAVGVGGVTVAVIGGGHAGAIPRRHAGLAAAIVDGGGAIVSEHPPWTTPTRGTFPRRNRLISGLAAATIVVEAGRRSGALITAGWALEQGRACFAVPGALDAPASVGCLALLRAYPDQVRVVAGVPELLEDLGLAPGAVGTTGTMVRSGRGGSGPPGPAAPGASPDAVLAALPAPVAAAARSLVGGSRPVDHVVAATGLPVPGALAALTMLEDLGLVSAAYGRYRLAGGLSDLA